LLQKGLLSPFPPEKAASGATDHAPHLRDHTDRAHAQHHFVFDDDGCVNGSIITSKFSAVTDAT
jgi:hypothetical protein